MGSWISFNSTFALPIGLYLLRNGFSYYRSIQATYHQRKPEICSTPPLVSRVLNICFISAIIALVSTLPQFTEPNIFSITNTRLQSSQGVIFKRLSDFRPISGVEAAIKPLFNTTEARLIYLAYGPYVLLDCPFCQPADPRSYLFYAIPFISAPHLLHLAVLGVVTSCLLGGPEAARWRMIAYMSGMALAIGDIWIHASYNVKENTKKTKSADLDSFYWNMRLTRGLCISVVDALLGLVIWLGATKRFFLKPTTSKTEKVSKVANVVEVANKNLWGTGNVRNVVVRDKQLRERVMNYWLAERDLYEDRSVVDAVNDTMARTNDISSLEQIAWREAGEICQVHIPTSKG